MGRNESNGDRIVQSMLEMVLDIGFFSITGVVSTVLAATAAVMVVTAHSMTTPSGHATGNASCNHACACAAVGLPGCLGNTSSYESRQAAGGLRRDARHFLDAPWLQSC